MNDILPRVSQEVIIDDGLKSVLALPDLNPQKSRTGDQEFLRSVLN